MQLALLHHLGEESDDLFTSLVAAAMLGNGKIREEHGKGGKTLIDMLEETSHISEEVLPHFLAHQATGSSQDDQFAEGSAQINSTLITPLGKEHLRFLDDLIDVSAHLVGLQAAAHEPQLLVASGQINVIHNALAKERNSKLVGLVLVQVHVSSFEERLVRLGTA